MPVLTFIAHARKGIRRVAHACHMLRSISSQRSLHTLPICVLYVTTMNSLHNYGINCDASLSETERSITQSIPMSCISSIRSELFLDAKESGLVAGGDALVTR